MIIGINGWAGAGKDTVADILVKDFAFVKMAFADPLRDMALAIDAPMTTDADGDLVRYSELLDSIGYRQAKDEYLEVRRYLQRIGTEAVREIIGQDTWVDIAMRRSAEFPRVVFSDMRFQNEASAVANAVEGTTIRIRRPGVEAANDHPSEHDLDTWNFHYTIDNDGSLTDLRAKVGAMLDAVDPIV